MGRVAHDILSFGNCLGALLSLGGGGVIVLGGNFLGGNCPRDGDCPDRRKKVSR